MATDKNLNNVANITLKNNKIKSRNNKKPKNTKNLSGENEKLKIFDFEFLILEL